MSTPFAASGKVMTAIQPEFGRRYRRLDVHNALTCRGRVEVGAIDQASESLSWNRQYLDDSVLYNEDDCRATRLIKDWMASGGAKNRD